MKSTGYKLIFPCIFYFLFFCILTHPIILKFSTHFFANDGDGLQNVWNIWWFNKAVIKLHLSPWETSYLHYPFGISLLGHTLNPFNGLLGLFLLRFLTLIETYNFIVIFSFVTGGLTAYLLAYHLTKAYWSSLIAGFIFTFSNYHFAHAQGHLQLVSLEWLPLFLLCFYILLTKPCIKMALASAAVLFAVILCDYYYFFYSILTAGLMMIGYAATRKDIFYLFRKKHGFPFLIFLVASSLTSGFLVMPLIFLNIRDPLLGSHPEKAFSLDLLAPLIPGGCWRFSNLTEFYWSKLPGNISESSVYLGISVLFLLKYVFVKRRNFEFQELWLWYLCLFFFLVLSLGPVLHIWGRELPYVKLPYVVLAWLLPPLKMSGCPVRMMVMVFLSASVICAMGLKLLFQGASRSKRLLIAVLLATLFFEYLPRPLPASRIKLPGYVEFLRKTSDDKGVLDMVASPSLALYYQTIHQKPMAFGYISRIPKSVNEQNDKIIKIVLHKKYSKLYRKFNIRYLIVSADPETTSGGFSITQADLDTLSHDPAIILVYEDQNVKVYDLGSLKNTSYDPYPHHRNNCLYTE